MQFKVEIMQCIEHDNKSLDSDKKYLPFTSFLLLLLLLLFLFLLLLLLLCTLPRGNEATCGYRYCDLASVI